MKFSYYFSILFFLFTLLFFSQAQAKYQFFNSHYHPDKGCQQVERNLFFCGNQLQLERVQSWIDHVLKTEIGKETLFALLSAPHSILISHNKLSISTAGKTLAPLTFDLSNGIGSDVVIQMNLDMPESGTHLVTHSQRKLIPFTALVNFFHELSHARHGINGTWLAIDPEGQAVDDENIFRHQNGILRGEKNPPLRNLKYTDYDQQIWFGD